MPSFIATFQFIFRVRYQALVTLLITLSGFSVIVNAQRSTTDGTTPAALSPGAPAGSYALSGFETVNFYNGGLNCTVPLLGLSGRGVAAMTVSLPIEQKWRVDHNDEFGVHTPVAYWWNGLAPGYGPGVLQARHVVEGCPTNNLYTSTLTRLTFTAGDGTEIELRDQATGGAPQNSLSPCYPGYSGNLNGYNRGTVFITADGSAATFISDTTIYDRVQSGSLPTLSYPSGYLMTRDGTRYRIDNGLVSWLRDRNGNKLTFTYNAQNRVTKITDSLNREVNINYDVQDISPYGLCDQIIFKGTGGATRTIRVSRTTLGGALRTTQPYDSATLATYATLFPGLNGSSYTNYDAWKTSSVWLPDGRRYQFSYNIYGELARLVLPTGGAMEYDWDHGVAGGPGPGGEIWRRVTQRRVYANGSTLENKTTYGATGQSTTSYVTVDQFNATNTLLAREMHYYYGNPAAYLNTGIFDYPVWNHGKEYKSEIYQVSNGVAGSASRRVENTWQAGCAITTWAYNNALPNNVRIAETITTLVDSNQVSKQAFSYDCYNNKTDTTEYDFGLSAAGSLLRRLHTDFLTTNPVNGADYANNANLHIRNLPSKTQVFDGANNKKSEIVIEYDNFSASTGHAPLVTRANISGFDPAFSASYTTRGNVTATTSYANATNLTGAITTYAQYDIAGNVVKTIDANGNATMLEYDDRFGAPNGEAQSNTSPSELASLGQSSFAFPTKGTNAVGHIAYSQFDYYLGKPVDTEDPNNVKSSVYYNDPLDRPTQGRSNVTSATAYYSQTTIAYDDTNHVITSTSDKDAAGDNVLTGKAYYDGLGRTYRTAGKEGGTTWSYKDTNFDALGRAFQVSNPYRTTPTEWTTSTFDALGRLTQVTSPDNSTVQSQYSGNIVTVIDQAKKVRRSMTDGLGRLLRVDEPTRDFTTTEAAQNPLNPDLVLGAIGTPNQPTSYTYDTLDNLMTVTQTGLNASNTSVTQTRSFVYDSLKRLTAATNPESGTTTYLYDNNGNLKQKTDALGKWNFYNYDALNRNYETYANNATPYTLHVYDGATNGKGRLWYTMTNSWYSGGSGGQYLDTTTNDAYDALGRPVTQRQNFRINNDTAWSSNYTTSRTYDLAGNVLSQTNPSGKVVNYTYDQAARLASFTGNLGETNQRTYATGMTYNAASLMTREQFGTDTALYHRTHYNNRLQAYDTRVGTDNSTSLDADDPNVWQYAAGSWNRGALRLFYSKDSNNNPITGNGGLNNNGNLYRMDHFMPGNDTVTNYTMSEGSYQYDHLNRLLNVTEKKNNNGASSDAYKQTNTFDRWGNRTIDQNNTWAYDGSVWSEDAVPTGAVAAGDTDGWNWVTTGPTPFSGTSAHQSATVAGLHQHYFYGATNTITPAAGESLYAWVYLDPTSPPTEVMLQWNNGDWEHRAYWGANTITYWGVDGTNSRRYMGALPATGGWVRLEVPAASVGLVGNTINGMAFTLIGGKATWDRAGKTAVTGGGINQDKYTVDATNNRFTELAYDAVGNVTKDKIIGSGRMEYKYDGNNHVTAAGVNFVTNNTAPTSQYVYDASGKRTRKIVSGVETWFVYGMDGELVAEYNANGAVGSPQKEYGYRGGQLFIVYDSAEAANKQLQWMVADQLGTPRMVIDKTGSLSGIKRHDYLPFGEELGANVGIRSAGNGYTADQVKQKFTGKRRDDETNLDFFEARYFSSTQGRFTSPDEFTGGPTELFVAVAAHNPTFYAEIAEPQSLNKYTYCLNNPYKFVDPDGHQTTLADKIRYGVSTVREEAASAVNRAKEGAATVSRVVGETANGIAAAVSEDNGLPAQNLPQNSTGRAIGHTLAVVQSVGEIAGGGAMIVGGGTEAVVTSPACATGAGCVVPLAGAATAVGGVAISAHGAGVLGNTVNNILSKKTDLSKQKKDMTSGGTEQTLAELEAKQAKTRAGGTNPVNSTAKSKQNMKTAHKKIITLQDALDGALDH